MKETMSAQPFIIQRICWAVVILAGGGILCAGNPGIQAAEPPSGEAEAVPSIARGARLDANELDRSIEQVLGKREYSWRFPRERMEREEEPGVIRGFIQGVFNKTKEWIKTSVLFFRDLIKNLWERFFNRESSGESGGDSGQWKDWAQLLLFGVLGVVLVAAAILFYRVWKQRRNAGSEDLVEAAAARPDLAAENLMADQLPEESWLKLAREMVEQGELRLGLRAYYLAGLSRLAGRELIRVARFKSNREYEAELRRRPQAGQPVKEAFAENVLIFDRVWYGTGEVSPELLGLFKSNLERMSA
jgi:hypothetical protein